MSLINPKGCLPMALHFFSMVLLTLKLVSQLGTRLTGHRFGSIDRVSYHCHLSESPSTLLTTRSRGVSLGSRIRDSRTKAQKMRLVTIKGAQ